MSAEPEFRCPVCRATQTLRDSCRRCEADLRLVVRAYQRLAYVNRQAADALASGNHQHEQELTNERRWLLGKQV